MKAKVLVCIIVLITFLIPIDGFAGFESMSTVTYEGSGVSRPGKTGDIDIVGTWGFLIDDGFVTIYIDEIKNNRSSGVSGDLGVSLWASKERPVWNETIPTGYEIGSWTVEPLYAGQSHTDQIGIQEVGYVPYGCYYVTLVLIEYSVADATWYYTDFSTADNVGSGGDLFSFGGADCGSGYDCTDNLENGIICMRDGRFKVRLLWMDFDYVTRPVILKRQSDEAAIGVFQNNRNDVTVVAKVTKGCLVNDHYWVWLGAFTQANLNMIVTDMATGQQQNYLKSLGGLMTTIKDNSTFPCE